MHISRSIRLIAVFLTIGVSPLGGSVLLAQKPPSAPPAATAAGQEAPAPGGLPARTAPPRTLRDHWHVYAAFTLAWILLFGYVVSVGRRFAAVERELERLGEG